MVALVFEACSRKKRKANRLNELEMILLEYYIKFRSRNQESRIYFRINGLRHGEQVNRKFRIKPFLSQNWGACVYTKIWKEESGNSKLLRLYHQGIDQM